MPELWAKAYPRKAFFIEMFTRDISLEDCILDLIDNSIDSLIRTQKLEASDILFAKGRYKRKGIRHKIKVSISEDEFEIQDNCGGITREDAQEDVFNFGHSSGYSAFETGRRLGAYGIGLKRALFKIGKRFEVISKTTSGGFDMDVDVTDWIKKDEEIADWRFLLHANRSVIESKAGTLVRISDFPKDIRNAMSDSTLPKRLSRQVSQTYSEFLKSFIEVEINGNPVESQPIPLGISSETKPSIEDFSSGEVKVKLIANFASKGPKGTWETATAGWYVLCNGRVVISADKTQLTGWGDGILPVYQPKFRGFVGVAMFESSNPLELPWTTTKRNLNRDAIVFRQARKRMAIVAKPVIRTLEKFYGPEKDESAEEREIAESMQQADLIETATKGPSLFEIGPKAQKKVPSTEQLTIKVKKSELAAIRSHLRQPKMSKVEIGRQIFEYYMKSEGLR